MAKVRDGWKGELADGLKETGIVLDDAGRRVYAPYDTTRTVVDSVLDRDTEALRDQVIDKAKDTGKDKLIDKAKDVAPKPIKKAWDTYDDYQAGKA